MKTSILTSVAKKPDNKIADDDHLQRKDLTKSQFRQGLNELKTKYKDFKQGAPTK